MWPKADLILHGGPIWLGRDAGFAEALAVRHGRVLATGTPETLDGLVGPRTRRLDLAGRFAMPGFNDAHMHPLAVGLALNQADVRPAVAPTLADLLNRVADRAAAAPPGEWIVANGYDQFRLDVRRHPLRRELDAAAPANPVFVWRTCGHVGVANSMALDALGLTAETPDPPGGAIGRAAGELTGLLSERAAFQLNTALPTPDRATMIEAIAAAGRLFLSQGITSVMDAAVGSVAGLAELRAWSEARRNGRLPVRATLCLFGDPGGVVESAAKHGLVTGIGDEWLKIGPVKLFLDGSAGAGTAAVVEPYRDGGRGILCYEDRAVDERVAWLHGAGYQIAVHAIGDRAIAQVIGAVEAAQRRAPGRDRRHRIEHCGLADAEQIARMARLGMTVASQPVFMRDFAELYADTLGAARTSAAYPMRAWLQAGLRPAASSDANVCDSDPLPGLHAMMTRASAAGTVFGEAQRLSPQEALQAYTEFAAYGQFSEREKGTLEPGMLADIVVLSRNPFAVPPDAILEDTCCELTIVEGSIAFARDA